MTQYMRRAELVDANLVDAKDLTLGWNVVHDDGTLEVVDPATFGKHYALPDAPALQITLPVRGPIVMG